MSFKEKKVDSIINDMENNELLEVCKLARKKKEAFYCIHHKSFDCNDTFKCWGLSKGHSIYCIDDFKVVERKLKEKKC